MSDGRLRLALKIGIFFEKMRFHPLTVLNFNSIIVRVVSDYG